MVSATAASAASCADIILPGCKTALAEAFAVHRPGLSMASNRQKRTNKMFTGL